MTQSSSKVLILIGVFILSTVFFFAFINRTLIPSRAQQDTNFDVFISEKSISCNPDGACTVNLYANSAAGAGIAGVEGKVKYSQGLVFKGVQNTSQCGASTAGLDMELKLKDDPNNQVIEFALVSLKRDSELKSGGPLCVTSLNFVNNAGLTRPFPASESVSLTEAVAWKAVGSVQFNAKVDTGTSTITLTPDVPVTPMPGPGGGGGTCAKKAQGDCNCDGSVNMSDFEALRSEMTGDVKGISCDFNANGVSDSADLDIWKLNIDTIRTTAN